MRKKSFLIFSLILILIIINSCKEKTGESNRITVVSYGGGAYHQSHREVFFKPFEEFNGVHIEPVVWNAEYGKLKIMVESGNVPWDVVEVTDAQFKRGKKENLFQKLNIVPSDGEFLPGTIEEYGVANVYWGTVLSYLPDSFPNEEPKTWKDFWDIIKFPGSRGLYDDPRGNLEFALLADGVTKEELYPLDIERAFRKLDEIKPHIRVWWNDGTQSIQIILNKSVMLSSAWNGRIFALNKEGIKIDYSWDGAALELDWWVSPLGSKNIITSSRFIVFASLPERMARQAKLIGYGPVNASALDFVGPDIQKQLPTFPENLKKAFIVDSNWWSENEAEIMKKWLEWKAK